jgi:hypothetical protein
LIQKKTTEKGFPDSKEIREAFLRIVKKL